MWFVLTVILANVDHLRNAWVRMFFPSENFPTPTAFKAAKRTVYIVYGFRGVMARGATKVERERQHIS